MPSVYYAVFFSLILFNIIYSVSSECNESNIEYNQDYPQILNRQKRQLLFPIATLLQCSFLVATPVQLTRYNIFMNQGFQLNFMLPNMRSQLPVSFLGVPPVIDVARSRTKRENLENSRSAGKFSMNHQADGEFDVFTSENMYFFIGKALESYGYNGTECVLHSICQLAKIPFQKDEDLLHEIIHFIMTPSEHDEVSVTRNDTNTDRLFSNKYSRKLPQITHTFNDYLKAENSGKSEEDCDELYKFCKTSPLEKFSELEYENDYEAED